MPWKCKKCGSREVIVTIPAWMEIHWVGDEKEGSHMYDRDCEDNDADNYDPDLPISITCASKCDKVEDECHNVWAVGTTAVLHDRFERVAK